ncbi:MAG: hypothetical protein ABII72_01190 [Parcubacteria group bacterium]
MPKKIGEFRPDQSRVPQKEVELTKQQQQFLDRLNTLSTLGVEVEIGQCQRDLKEGNVIGSKPVAFAANLKWKIGVLQGELERKQVETAEQQVEAREMDKSLDELAGTISESLPELEDIANRSNQFTKAVRKVPVNSRGAYDKDEWETYLGIVNGDHSFSQRAVHCLYINEVIVPGLKRFLDIDLEAIKEETQPANKWSQFYFRTSTQYKNYASLLFRAQLFLEAMERQFDDEDLPKLKTAIDKVAGGFKKVFEDGFKVKLFDKIKLLEPLPENLEGQQVEAERSHKKAWRLKYELPQYREMIFQAANNQDDKSKMVVDIEGFAFIQRDGGKRTAYIISYNESDWKGA